MPPERSPADLLKVLLRRAEPAAREFLRALQTAEAAADQGARKPRLSLPAGVSLPPAPSNRGSNLLMGGKLLGGLTQRISKEATKLKTEAEYAGPEESNAALATPSAPPPSPPSKSPHSSWCALRGARLAMSV